MKAIAAREAKNRFGSLMDAAQREPVAIEKHGRPVAVLMSVEEYKMIKSNRLHSEVKAGLDQLEQRFYWLAEHVAAGKSKGEIAQDISSFPQGRHVIFYRASSSLLEVARVLHQSMDIEHQFDRS